MGLDVSTSGLFVLILLGLFVFGSLVVSSLSGGLLQDIYHVIPVPDGSACFRLMNGTHKFGCHSSAADGEGVVIVVKTVDELKDVKSCWRQRFEDYNGGFFVLIDISLLDRAMTTALRDSSCVRGLLLTDKVSVTLSTPTIVASHDIQCPNDGSSFYRDGCAKNSWNAKWATLPEGLQNIDWRKLSVFMDNETHISDIEKAAEESDKTDWHLRDEAQLTAGWDTFKQHFNQLHTNMTGLLQETMSAQDSRSLSSNLDIVRALTMVADDVRDKFLEVT